MKNFEHLLNFNARAALARRNLSDFISYTKPDYTFNWHHISICQQLQRFTNGEITRLMIFVPPQHGKSEIATRRFPAFQLGKKPKSRIAICSYSATLAMSFNRDVQRIIDDEKYHDVFPDTILNESNVSTNAQGSYLRNSEIFETVGFRGFIKTVGVGGSLTGTPIDIGIIDDPFKDREEAMSIRIREKVWSWYTDVFETRLHNESQQLIIMTRWDPDDLAGRILRRDGSKWAVISYPAIKEHDNDYDPRQIGEALWPEKHSLERLSLIRDTSPITFNSLYQQDPKPSTGSLVFPEWSEYSEEPDIEPLIGLDFGYSNDPTAIVQVKVRKGEMYVRELLYETGLTNSPLDDRMRMMDLKRRRIVADSAEPKTIDELRKERGYNMIPCIKGQGSVSAGINWIKDHKLFVHKDSHNLKRELSNYQYIMVGGQSTNEPMDAFNHCIDAIRYTKALFRQSTGLKMSFHR
jgi:hypothetical protein